MDSHDRLYRQLLRLVVLSKFYFTSREPPSSLLPDKHLCFWTNDDKDNTCALDKAAISLLDNDACAFDYWGGFGQWPDHWTVGLLSAAVSNLVSDTNEWLPIALQ